MVSMISEPIEKISSLKGKPVMLTVGMFDGVHRGHRFFIQQLVAEAQKRDMIPVLISMYPHPRKVLAGKKFKCLTTLEEKAEYLDELGVSDFIVLKTTRELLGKTAAEFLTYLKEKNLNVQAVALGFNNRFGRKADDEKPIEQVVRDAGMEFVRIPGYGEKVSSTTIREHLEHGRVEAAADLLGYHYALFGHVVEGNKLGRTIGFPTANIKVDSMDKLIPEVGVYAVKCTHNNMVYSGMMNIGYRPTIEEHSKDLYLEVHIPGEQLDIYNEPVKIEYFKKIRDEKKFKNLDELQTQLKKDKDFIIQYFRANFVALKK
jgi:riboflavin kinase/FMN adenylyltransferase